jgi:hypothetical protein
LYDYNTKIEEKKRNKKNRYHIYIGTGELKFAFGTRKWRVVSLQIESLGHMPSDVNQCPLSLFVPVPLPHPGHTTSVSLYSFFWAGHSKLMLKHCTVPLPHSAIAT